MNNLPPTVFVDIDGTLVQFNESIPGLIQDLLIWTGDCGTLSGSAEKLAEWHQKGIRIILVTGRPESMRDLTVKQLTEQGMIWDQLIMGCGSGVRYLINDVESGKEAKAWAINVVRNEGIGAIDLDRLITGRWAEYLTEAQKCEGFNSGLVIESPTNKTEPIESNEK